MGSTHSFAPVEEVVEEEEEEEKMRNTFACSRRKERTKFRGEEREVRGAERSRRNETALWLVQKEKEEMRIERRRGAEKDGECARVRSGRN